MGNAPVIDRLQLNIHQIGNTLAWSILFNIGVICVLMKHNKHAFFVHAIFGIMMLVLNYGCILQLLIPFGFNISVAKNGYYLEIHAIIGIMLLVLVVVQVLGGFYSRLTQQKLQAKCLRILFIKKCHKAFGYSMAIIYKINILIWWYDFIPFYILIVWEFIFVATLIYIKLFFPKLTSVIVDEQVEDMVENQSRSLMKVSSLKQIRERVNNFIIFGNYIYNAEPLKKLHPGGFEVISTILGREVDRFLYGMYASELLPEVAAYSHTKHSLKLLGLPIAKYQVPLTYNAFQENEVIPVKINFIQKISEKTMIYMLGLTPISPYFSFEFKFYTDVRQLGQYYSLTLDDKITRLYTAVNFISSQNLNLMEQIFKKTVIDKELVEILPKEEIKRRKSSKSSELKEIQSIMLDQSELIYEKKIEQNTKNRCFLPVMLKIYKEGKLTSLLYKQIFRNVNIKLSLPKGRGLQLSETKPGKIIILAGGTGIFPFCDLIDLLFKSLLIEREHHKSDTILKQNPLLTSNPFEQYTFVLMVAINEPQDIHPLTLQQLIKLSKAEGSKFQMKITFRVSKNQYDIAKEDSKINFTKEYFDNMVIEEAKTDNFSRLWVCGPPKMNTTTAASMLKNGFQREDFLLL